MSTTPLSTTQERIERSIFERIRLELIDKGYLPDISIPPFNTGDGAAQIAWNAELVVIATAKDYAIELIGAGSYDKADEKKVPRIVIQAGEFIEGELGGDQQRTFDLNDAQDAFDVVRRPTSFSDYYTNIHVIANTTEQLRIAQAVLSLAMQTKGYLPLYDVDPAVIQPSGNFFYRKTGAGNLPNTDEGVIEKVYSYVITDVLEADCPTELDGASIITQIDLDTEGTVTGFTEPFPECPPATMTFNTIVYGDLPAGITTNVIIKDTNGDVQGWLVGTTIFVPAGVGAGLLVSLNGIGTVTITGPTNIPVIDTLGNPVGFWNGTSWVVPALPVPVISYSRPVPTYKISYNLHDEGYQFINTTDTYVVPIGALENSIDPTDWYKITLDERSKGHLYRFLGLNEGYYNSDDGTYRLSNGTLSDRATVLDNDDYLLDRYTGLAYFTRRLGAANLPTSMAAAESSTRNGFIDWHPILISQHYSILDGTLSQPTYDTSSPIFNIQLQKWSASPSGTNPTINGISITTTGVSIVRAYTISDAGCQMRYALN